MLQDSFGVQHASQTTAKPYYNPMLAGTTLYRDRRERNKKKTLFSISAQKKFATMKLPRRHPGAHPFKPGRHHTTWLEQHHARPT
ncbi:hypothetical protein OM427_08095 [Halomonas sp. 18H]|uniref:hypothetical protein n=1 Tax=Halomonas almeriensis TaxID=308163 RepID=UPI002231D464|nr:MULTISPECIES: hypothetical protein [Halomonas]MCW4149494.1 hypothetical protein [Halomonas sp. 18H]MDN3553560.1 hypothetical protein [Halomonas almeriensis]